MLTVLMIMPYSKAYLRQLLGNQEKELFDDYCVNTQGIIEVLEDGSTVVLNYIYKGTEAPTQNDVKAGVDVRPNRVIKFLCSGEHQIYGQAYLSMADKEGNTIDIDRTVARRYEKLFNKGM